MTTAPQQGPSAAVLTIRDVVKSFNDKRALDGVSLDLVKNECLGLLGPNGAGKTTLVRSIMGRVRLDSGVITANGLTLQLDTPRSGIGWVPQDLALYPLLSAEENLSVFAQFFGLKGAAAKDAVQWGLNWAALTDRRNDPVKTFSGGMKRRLNLAAGLLSRAPIALLDEPTVGVDPQSRERIYGMIEELRAGGTAIIYTSHYMEEVERLCDRVAIIDHGRIIAEGRSQDLIRETFGTGAELSVRVKADGAAVATWAAQHNAKLDADVAHFAVADPAAQIPDVLRSAALAGVIVEDLSLRTPRLQDLFLHLTGKELRE